MATTKPGLSDEIAILKDEIESAKKGIGDFQKRHFNGDQEKVLVYCLQRAIDISEGCVLAVEARLPESLDVLNRSLFEIFVEVNWITLSKENAKSFAEAAVAELKTNMRGALNKGVGKVLSTVTGEDKSQEILSSPLMQNIPGRLGIGRMAEDGGLGKIYTMLYGYYSMRSHGFSFGIAEMATVEAQLDSTTAAAAAMMRCINFIVTAWMVKRQRTTVSQIRRILGI